MNEVSVMDAARLFADRIERDGADRLSAIVDMVYDTPGVFVRLSKTMTYPEFVLAAERAKTQAIWSFSRTAGSGAIVDLKSFARRPEYLVSEDEGGITAWVNAVAIEDERDFKRVQVVASSTAANYRRSIEAGVWQGLQFRLNNRFARPSYDLNALRRDEHDPVHELLVRKGIR